MHIRPSASNGDTGVGLQVMPRSPGAKALRSWGGI
jgi:hypothetical protein